MLLLAHLLLQNPAWRRKRLRVLRVIQRTEAVEKVRAHIRALSGTHFDPQVVDVFMQSLSEIGDSGDLPQVAEAKTPRPDDAAQEVLS